MNADAAWIVDQTVYDRYLAALLRGDRASCFRIVEDLRPSAANIEDIFAHLLTRALYDVGGLWETHRISVAVEHRATAITSAILTAVEPLVFSAGPPRTRSILIACVAGEQHQIGARMIADLCELRGWRGHLLGSRASLDELLRAIEELRPSMLGFSLALSTNLPFLREAIEGVVAVHPRLPIVVGGQAFRLGGQEALAGYPSVRHASSFAELERMLASFDRDADGL